MPEPSMLIRANTDAARPVDQPSVPRHGVGHLPQRGLSQASDHRYVSEDSMSQLYPEPDSLAAGEFTAGN